MLMLTRDSLPITSSPADSDHSCHTLFSRSVELSSYSVDDAIRGHRIKGRRSSVSASASGRLTASNGLHDLVRSAAFRCVHLRHPPCRPHISRPPPAEARLPFTSSPLERIQSQIHSVSYAQPLAASTLTDRNKYGHSSMRHVPRGPARLEPPHNTRRDSRAQSEVSWLLLLPSSHLSSSSWVCTRCVT